MEVRKMLYIEAEPIEIGLPETVMQTNAGIMPVHYLQPPNAPQGVCQYIGARELRKANESSAMGSYNRQKRKAHEAEVARRQAQRAKKLRASTKKSSRYR